MIGTTTVFKRAALSVQCFEVVPIKSILLTLLIRGTLFVVLGIKERVRGIHWENNSGPISTE